MADERKKVTDANRRISRGDEDDAAEPVSPAETDVERANERIARGADREREQPLRREQALKRPPD